MFSMARLEFQRVDVLEMFGNDVSCEIYVYEIILIYEDQIFCTRGLLIRTHSDFLR